MAALSAPVIEPEHAPRAIDRGIGQRHPAPSLIQPGDGDVGVDDVEHWIARNERRGVSVGAQAEVDEIQNRRRPRNPCERPRVNGGGAIQVCRFDRHRVDLRQAPPVIARAATLHVRQVAIRIPVRGDPFVYLEDVDPGPRHIE